MCFIIFSEMYKSKGAKSITSAELSEISRDLGFDCNDAQLEEFKGISKYIAITFTQKRLLL